MCGIDAKIQTYGIPVLDETVPSSVQKGGDGGHEGRRLILELSRAATEWEDAVGLASWGPLESKLENAHRAIYAP